MLDFFYKFCYAVPLWKPFLELDTDQSGLMQTIV